MESRMGGAALEVTVWRKTIAVGHGVVWACVGAALSIAATATDVAAQNKLLTSANPPAVPAALPEDLEEDAPDPQEEPPLALCETDVRLSGTFYNARRPERSFATFHVSAGHVGEVYRVGERVGAYAILNVGPRSVVLDDGGAGCYLQLGGMSVQPQKKKAAAKPHKRRPRKRRSSKNAFTDQELSDNIRALGGNKYEVKQELLAKVITRTAQLTRTTRWTQVRGYSSVTGLRLVKLANNGLLARLGLKPGDTVKTLNGLQLTSLEGALEAQKLISSTPHLSLLIQRRGTPVTLDYHVVP